jgi:hypothetical protein
MHLNEQEMNFMEQICESGQHSTQTRKNAFVYWGSEESTPTPTLTPTLNPSPTP